MQIPDEAVQAAQNEFNKFGYTAANEKALIAALTAALPFLQGVKVKPVGWETQEEYKLEQRAFHWTAAWSEEDTRSLINDLWSQYCAAAEPSPRAQALEEAAALFNPDPDDDLDTIGKLIKEAHRQKILALRSITPGALSSKPVADGWLPIETAPKDGTEFIGWDGKWPFRCSAGKQYVLYPHMEGGPTYRDVWDGHYYDSLTIERPTHWRPLPASPGASE